MRYAHNFIDLEYNAEIVAVVRSINWLYSISLLIFIYIVLNDIRIRDTFPFRLRSYFMDYR